MKLQAGAGALRDEADFVTWEIELKGEPLIADQSGVLIADGGEVLVVADLHLEKGSARARFGALLPPYDTRSTLKRLATAIDYWRPDMVIALGDSFHDVGGGNRLSPEDRATLLSLQRGRTWMWIAGNHDPQLPEDLGGEREDSYCAARADVPARAGGGGQGRDRGALAPVRAGRPVGARPAAPVLCSGAGAIAAARVRCLCRWAERARSGDLGAVRGATRGGRAGERRHLSHLHPSVGGRLNRRVRLGAPLSRRDRAIGAPSTATVRQGAPYLTAPDVRPRINCREKIT